MQLSIFEIKLNVLDECQIIILIFVILVLQLLYLKYKILFKITNRY